MEKVDGEIGGYSARLKQANSKATKVLSRIEREEKLKSEHYQKLIRLKDSKEGLDSTDEVTVAEWSLKQSSKFFQWQSKNFEITSAWPVVGHTKWDNGHLEWKKFSVQRDPGGAKGKVEGEFARGLYANVTLKTSKQIMNSDKIRSLNAEIRTAQECLDDLKRNIEERLKERQEYLEEIRLLREYIAERNKTKERLSRDPIPITEALQRLEDIKTAPTTLLLIGSTGSGKSTLGNFLFDPRDRHIFGKEQTFPTARDNKPETQSVSTQVAREQLGKRAVRIIDTPGLNESATHDLSHMIDIVKTLNTVKSISACILCLKFESEIDSHYRATVSYYRKLLPSLFEGNVVIVLTQYQTDPRSEMQRKMQGIDIDTIVTNAQRAVRKVADLSYCPPVFMIDSLPMEDEREQSERTRQAILDFIRATMKPIHLSDLKVAKADELRQIDDKEMVRVDGEIGGYNAQLKQANSKAAKVLSRIQREEKLKSEHDELKRNIEERLEEYQEYHEEMRLLKQIKYSDKIRSLNAELRTAQERLDELKRNIQEGLEEHQEYFEDIRLLREYIDKKNETKKRLSRDPIPIAEALQRLEELHCN